MIDQGHRKLTADAGSVKASNESHAQTVEAGVDAARRKERINTAILVAREIHRDLPMLSLERLEQWMKAGVNRNRKVFSRIVLIALCIAHPNRASGKVNIVQRDLALREAAASVKGNLECCSHPFRLVDQPSSQLLNLGVGQFRFNPWRSPRYSKVGNRIGFGIFPSNAFVYELRQEFQFEQRGVVTNFPAVNLVGHAPAKVRLAMRVFDLAWVDYSFATQEECYGLPSGSVPSRGFGCPVLPVGSEVAGNPGQKSWTGVDRADSVFLRGQLVGESLGFTGIGCPGRFLPPFAGIQIPVPDRPERRSSLLTNGRHAGDLPNATQGVKQNRMDSGGLTGRKMAADVVTKATITPRGTDFTYGV